MPFYWLLIYSGTYLLSLFFFMCKQCNEVVFVYTYTLVSDEVV